jgi:hypothetical protein
MNTPSVCACVCAATAAPTGLFRDPVAANRSAAHKRADHATQKAARVLARAHNKPERVTLFKDSAHLQAKHKGFASVDGVLAHQKAAKSMHAVQRQAEKTSVLQVENLALRDGLLHEKNSSQVGLVCVCVVF